MLKLALFVALLALTSSQTTDSMTTETKNGTAPSSNSGAAGGTALLDRLTRFFESANGVLVGLLVASQAIIACLLGCVAKLRRWFCYRHRQPPQEEEGRQLDELLSGHDQRS